MSMNESEFTQNGQGVGPMYDLRAFEAGERAERERIAPIIEAAKVLRAARRAVDEYEGLRFREHPDGRAMFNNDRMGLLRATHRHAGRDLDRAIDTYFEGEVKA